MTFAVHTFETNPDSDNNHAFSFHETIGEGQSVYFMAKMGNKSDDSKKGAELLFGTAVEQLEQSNLKDGYDKFEEALRVVNFEAKKHANIIGPDCDIVIAYFDFHNLYLTQTGSSEAYLVRGNNLSQISESGEEGEDLFLNILSGQVSVDDTIVMSSSRILRFLTTSQLTETFGRSDFGNSCSILRHELTTAADEDIVVTAIGIGKKDSSLGAGFLSKVVSKGKTKKSAPKPAVEELEPVDLDDKEILDNPDIEVVEAVEEEYEPKASPFAVLGDLASKLKGFKPEKNLIIIAGSILGILLIGLISRFALSYKSEDILLIEERLASAKTSIEQAQTFVNQGEKDTATTHIDTAKFALQDVINSENKEFRTQAQFVMTQIQEIQDQLENVTKVKPDVLANIGAKNNSFRAQGLISMQGNVFAYDSKVLHKTIRNIVEKEFPITEKESIIAGTSREEQNTLVFMTDGPRLIEYKDGIINPMATEDESWKRGIDVKNFTSRFTYVLDPAENQIWKYTRQRSSYSSGSPYSEGADLSQAVSFAIDGSIYVLSEDGTIQKLFRGEKQDFEFKALPAQPIRGKGLKIITTEDLSFLYVLDPNNSRILIFDKGERFATYKRQVQFDLEGDKAIDFSVDVTGQKINLVSETKLYEFSL